MNVQMNTMAPAAATKNAPLAPNKTYTGTVLEQTGPNTALVQVGRDKVEMTFASDVPEGSFQFQVKGQTAEGYLIEQVTETAETAEPSIEETKTAAKGEAALLEDVPPELKNAIARLLNTGIEKTPETVARLVAALQGVHKDVLLALVSSPSDSALPVDVKELLLELLGESDGLIDESPEFKAAKQDPTLPNVIAADVVRVATPIKQDVLEAPEPALRTFVQQLPEQERPELLARIERGDKAVRTELAARFPEERPASLLRHERITEPKLVQVREVTPRLAEMTNDFRSNQRTIVSQLRQVETLVEARPLQVAQVIESTANRLRQTLQQTDATLHVSMKDEKQLIQVLSKLERGTELAYAGRGPEAKAVLTEARVFLEAFRFAPANVRTTYLPEVSEKPVPYQPRENSARVLQETVQRVTQQTEQLKLQTTELKMAPAATPEAARLQSFLSTQQQINKPENNQLQQLILSLPVQIVEQTAGLHVHIHTKRPDEVIDRENNTLSVQLETPRLGDIGIKVETVSRKMQITIENDFPLLERLAGPFLERTTEALRATGYEDVRIKFDAFTREAVDTPKPKQQEETGYDYRI